MATTVVTVKQLTSTISSLKPEVEKTLIAFKRFTTFCMYAETVIDCVTLVQQLTKLGYLSQGAWYGIDFVRDLNTRGKMRIYRMNIRESH